ncbi:Meiosis-specific nuclear structural protein 1 [Intoshia linei]|uniref:Meiosis-specific nuclear structural protein 1 n=1 Tax=Intoshia linei TaxID=1819745 RepID=A0A177AU45_9BILA|nr:Meiosis-specific nuclear structural protein 1 [Intoshia linei]
MKVQIKSDINVSDSTVHVLPFATGYSGYSPVSQYLVTREQDGKILTSFRGYKLEGEKINLPKHFIGLVYNKTQNDEIISIQPVEKFNRFTYWTYETNLTSTKSIHEFMNWTDISEITTLRQNMLAREAELRIEKQRIDTEKSLKRERLTNFDNNSLEKCKNRRIKNFLESKDKIEKYENDKIKKKEEMENIILKRSQEESLSIELNRIKDEKIKAEKFRQMVRKNSVEIRELEAKLKLAYVLKTQKAQIAEKESLKYDEMKKNAVYNEMLKEELVKAKELEKELAISKWNERFIYKQQLEQQLQEQEIKKQEAFKEFLKEKLLIDEIIRKIYQEDQKEREQIIMKRKLHIEYIDNFKKQREIWKKQNDERIELENKNIEKYSHIIKKRQDDSDLYKKERESIQEKLHEKLSKDMIAKKEKLMQVENARMDLYAEEQERLEREKEIQKMALRIKEKLELQRISQDTQREKQKLKEVLKKEDEKFNTQLMLKFEQDLKINQLSQQRIRMKREEYKRNIQQQIEERHQQAEYLKQKALLELQFERDQENKRLSIIEEERNKLLSMHAEKLIGYLPKGVIRDQDDLLKLGEKFIEEYKYTPKFDEFLSDDEIESSNIQMDQLNIAPKEQQECEPDV